jgi:hypothetical protein
VRRLSNGIGKASGLNDLHNDMMVKISQKSLDIHSCLPLIFGGVSSILAALPKLGR